MTKLMPYVALATSAAVALSVARAQTTPDPAAVAARVTATLSKMTAADKVTMTHGMVALPMGPHVPALPADAIPSAGYVAGIPRLGVPSLRETDASLGVSYIAGLRKDGATALPSGLAQAASWDPGLMFRGGAMIGSEARAKGLDVMLAGGADLIRDPRNGRTFEYLSEDPLLTGMLAGAAIRGIQSNHIISTIKHFALNAQETGRQFVDVIISPAAARESDLLAFQIGIEQGQPGAVMCAYNEIDGHKACDDTWLLTTVLKGDWRYPGFVMSDFGATPNVHTALSGLDQQSGAAFDGRPYLDGDLRQKAAINPAYAARLDDMNRRILRSIYTLGLDRDTPRAGGKIDVQGHAALAEEIADRGIVLLRNEHGLLPLQGSLKSIAIIGGYADGGVLSGGGSTQVHGIEGPALIRPVFGDNDLSAFISQQYQRSSPLKAMQARVSPNTRLSYRDGRYITDAVTAARRSEIAIVFATQWMSEGMDVPDLSLPDGQDALIAAVASANPNTIVVLETGGPVKMPWLAKTAAILEAWYPGARGGEAIASILFGEINPSGHLPVTFPADESQLPRAKIDGSDWLEPNLVGLKPNPGATLTSNFNIEGSDVGYRWFARTVRSPLFPFGFGLSYTSFAFSDLRVDAKGATVTVANTGKRAGHAVVQIYLVSRNGKPVRRLVGFSSIPLEQGAQRSVTIEVDPRLLADWTTEGWVIAKGDYAFAAGRDADHLDPAVTIELPQRRWRD